MIEKLNYKSPWFLAQIKIKYIMLLHNFDYFPAGYPVTYFKEKYFILIFKEVLIFFQ